LKPREKPIARDRGKERLGWLVKETNRLCETLIDELLAKHKVKVKIKDTLGLPIPTINM
jgi:hypothetical protein